MELFLNIIRNNWSLKMKVLLAFLLFVSSLAVCTSSNHGGKTLRNPAFTGTDTPTLHVSYW